MGHGKLRKFKENETFSHLIQPSAGQLLIKNPDNALLLRDHPLKGNWNRDVFHGDGPLVLELGCGKGEYTIDLSRRNPDSCYIGVDIKGARLWKGAGYAEEQNIPNVAFLRTRVEFLPALFAEGEVSQIWLTFSDPQLKSENSRLTSPVFLDRYRRFLKKGGIVHLKTDSRFLHEYTKAVVACNGLEMLACTDDLYGSGREEVLRSSLAARVGEESVASLFEVRTFYENMFLSQGYKITYLAFTLDSESQNSYIHPDDFDAAWWRSVEGPRRSFGRG